MIIAISGVQGVGKSTLVEALKGEPEFSKFTFCTNLTRNLKDQGIPINEQGTAYTQMMVMMEHYRRVYVLEDENLVLDRCAIDGLVYSDVIVNKNQRSEFSIIDRLFDVCIDRYDYIFYIKPEFPLVDDGVRSMDIKFYNKVKREFNSTIKILKRAGCPIYTISGSVRERIQQIKDAINKL